MIECTLGEAPHARTLRICGELTVSSVSDAKSLLKATLVGLSPGALSLDLSKLDEVDSAGVQLLMCMTRSLSAAGIEMTLHACADCLIQAARELDLADERGCLGVPYGLPIGETA